MPRFPVSRALLLMEATVALAMAAAVIRLCSMAVVLRLADRRRDGRRDPEMVRRTRHAIQAAARRVPFRCVCFQRGLALHWMLRRRGIASLLHYGVREKHGLEAHVWVTVDGQMILGGDAAPGFACLVTRPALER